MKKTIGLATLCALSVGVLAAKGMFARLFSANYLPHRYCYLTQPWLVWTNVTMDGMIAASYVAIFGSLGLVLVRLHKKPELRAYRWIFVSVGGFILASSATHMMEIVTVWWPLYPLSAAFKVLCAAVSIPTAVVMAKRSPQIVTNICVYLNALRSSQQQQGDEEANYKGQIEAIERSQMMIEFDMEGEILRANENYLHVFGYTEAELEGRKHSFFVSEEDRSSAEYQQFWDNLSRGKYQVGHFRRIGKDGREVWIEASYNPIFDCNGVACKVLKFATDVTERVRSQAETREAVRALRNSEEFLEQTGRLAGIGGWDIDLLTNRVSWSTVTKRILAAAPDYQPILEDSINLYVGESKERISAAIARAAAGDGGWDLELSIVRTDGDTIWAHVVGTAELSDGKPVRLFGAIQDVTTRVHERIALETARERLALAAESGGTGIWDWDIEKNELLWDERMYQLYGRSSSINGQDLYAFWEASVHPEDRGPMSRILEDCIVGRKPYDAEFRIVWEDQSTHHIKVTGKMASADGGKTLRMVGTNSDITGRKQAENALRDQASLLDLSRDAIMLRDLRGKIRFWNQGAERMYGYSKQEAFARQSHQLLRTVFPLSLEAIDAELLDTGQWYGELEHITQDGKRIVVASRWVLQGGMNGEDFSVMEVNSDITARRLAEEALLKATRIAEDANRAKSEFLANMSHEIRTPMNAIMGMTYLALAAHPDGKQQVYLTKISNAADSLISIINDILDFSKMEADKMELERIPFLLQDVLDSVRDITVQKAQEKEIALLFPQFFPHEEEKTQYLVGDPGRLGQILINLVNNAVKFTQAGSVVIKVVAEEVSGESTRVSFSVTDTGIGMSAEQVGKLFRSFEQADTSVTRKYGGTGLGLAISKQLCNLMGGTLAVTSDPGHGSTFFFKLVFKKAIKPAALERRPMAEGLRDKSVLVVDDSEHSREVMVSMLRANGFVAEVAVGGEEALLLLTTASEAGKPFDVALIDWKMPGMNGVEIVREIKTYLKSSHTPAIVMVSAFDRDEVMADTEGLGLAGFLIKPVGESSLLQTIAAIFGMEETDSGTPLQPAAEGKLAALAGRRVLLVEDNEINVDLATALLEHLGILVIVAVDGSKGVERVASEPFDLVLMDIQMPVMDGLSATRLIRADPRFRNLPIIAMTAHAMSGDRELSLSAGMNEHLTKPINPKLLTDVLLRYMPVDGAALAIAGAIGDKSALPGAGPGAVLPKELPPFDLDAALRRAMGDPKLLRRMMLRFFNQYADAGSVMRAHLAEGKEEEAKRLAHSLKGVAATLEAVDLAAAAAEVEQALSSRQTAGLAALVDALEQALAPAVAAASTLDRRAASSRSPALPVRPPAKPRLRILVVDDEPIIIDLLTEIFAEDYEVLAATDGLEALRLAQSRLPELILLDVMMPGIDGYEVCRRLREDPQTRSLPVIFVSGIGDAASEAKGVGLGAVDYITKPINASIVKARVDNQINLKRERERVARVAAEEHLLKLNEEIRRSAASQQSSKEEMKLKDDFLSHVSHELRSPLASIASFSSIIADGLAGETTPEQKEYLAIVIKNVGQLRAMVEDLLDVTQARTGKLSLELQCVDMGAAVLDAFHTLQMAAEAKQIHFHHQVPGGLPSVCADPTRVVQTLIILLDNAIKFTPVRGEVRIEVRLLERDPAHLLVEVSDTGCGIDPKQVHSIFEHLYQITETGQAGRKGLGLGLHIAKELVIRQGGEIWVTSTAAGSQFFFTLPIHSGTSQIFPIWDAGDINGKDEKEGLSLSND